MKRREAFKKLGLLTIIGASSAGLISACTNSAKEKVANEAKPLPQDNKKQAISNWSDERSKLIINREPQKIVDTDNPTKAELKHSPDISFGEQDSKGNTLIKVTIGKDGIIHPATKEHWIDYLSLYINGNQYAHIEYVNGGIRAFDNFFATLNKGDKVKVESGCNLHGIWTSEVVYQ